ncbi:PE family protein [Mycobacterium sp. CSUR Q5927]|nr:PE family protein [Mycobacterium sp. CSUR Q5927]
MSFVTTQPEAMAATASNLQAIGSAMTAQSAAAAAPTTGIAPAGADEVSVLQATQFAAYGQLYQQISAQAAAIQEMFVNTLRTSADSYGSTETANSAAAGLGTATAGLGAGSGAADPTFGLGGIASNSSILAAMQAGTIGSAASEFTGLGKGYITSPSGVVHQVLPPDMPEAGLTGQTAPAAAAAPVSTTAGQAAARPLGAPTPPAWAGEPAPAAATPAALSGTSTAAAAPRAAAAAVPAGLPASSSEQGSRGRLRYGIKPKVMPRPPVG